MATTTINVNASFTGLSDTPASYSGQAGKAVFVKGDETGLEFGTVSGGDNLFTAPLTLGANRQHDMNGFGLTFLKSKFEFRAENGLSSGRALGVRNHTDTGWLTEFRNDGQNYYSNNQFYTNGTVLRWGGELAYKNRIYNSFGAFILEGDRNISFLGSGSEYVAYSQLDSSNFMIRCNNAEVPDGAIINNFVTFYYDNATNDFKIKFRKNDGSFVTKTL